LEIGIGTSLLFSYARKIKCQVFARCEAVHKSSAILTKRYLVLGLLDTEGEVARTKLYISLLFNYKKKSKILLGGSYVYQKLS
jgi:hypothetical protein